MIGGEKTILEARVAERFPPSSMPSPWSSDLFDIRLVGSLSIIHLPNTLGSLTMESRFG